MYGVFVLVYFVFLVVGQYQSFREAERRHGLFQSAQLACFVVAVQFETSLHHCFGVIVVAQDEITLSVFVQVFSRNLRS